MIYILSSVLDDPRFEGFQAESKSLDTVQRPRTTRALCIRRIGDDWEPLEVQGHVRRINHYPCINLVYPAFSEVAADKLRDLLEPNGELLPLKSKSGKYYFYNLTTVADVLCADRSTIDWLKEPITAAEIWRHEFREGADRSLSIFRIPENPNRAYVTDVFVNRVLSLGLTGLRFTKVWPVPPGHNWRKSRDRIMADPAAGEPEKDKRNVESAMAQSVYVEFPVGGMDVAVAAQRCRLDAFGEEVAAAIDDLDGASFSVGHLEYSEDCDDVRRLVFSCPDADELIKVLRDPIRDLAWPQPVRVLRRLGSYDNVEAPEQAVLV